MNRTRCQRPRFFVEIFLALAGNAVDGLHDAMTMAVPEQSRDLVACREIFRVSNFPGRLTSTSLRQTLSWTARRVAALTVLSSRRAPDCAAVSKPSTIQPGLMPLKM